MIGYVFAINGHINSADVYASRALFIKLWPKLLKASAVEAVAELNKDVEVTPIVSETVETFMADSEKPSAAAKDVTSRVKVVTREDDKNIFFETQDRSQRTAGFTETIFGNNRSNLTYKSYGERLDSQSLAISL